MECCLKHSNHLRQTNKYAINYNDYYFLGLCPRKTYYVLDVASTSIIDQPPLLTSYLFRSVSVIYNLFLAK